MTPLRRRARVNAAALVSVGSRSGRKAPERWGVVCKFVSRCAVVRSSTLVCSLRHLLSLILALILLVVIRGSPLVLVGS